MGAHFQEEALRFLRGLKRHNDREWFNARKDIYETELKAPMLRVIAEVNDAMLGFAPEYVRPPQKIMMRIYRDIRFSKDKRPYKVHVSGWWARQGLEKTSGGGFYFDVSGTEATIAAGVYMPERDQLLAIRRHLLLHHETLRTLMGGKKLRTLMQPIDAMTMTRGPKGFPPDHPAIDLLMQRQWGVAQTLAAKVAVGPGLVKAITDRFKLCTPIVTLLNEPLAQRPKKPLF